MTNVLIMLEKKFAAPMAVKKGEQLQSSLRQASSDGDVNPFRIFSPMFQSAEASREYFTPGEIHAYMVYQYIMQHQKFSGLLIDSGVLGLTMILGKWMSFTVFPKLTKRRLKQILVAFPTVYGVVSLQVYLATVLVLPWLLPSIAFNYYILSCYEGASND